MYKEKIVSGFVSDNTGLFMFPITVRMTEDRIGKTLSLSCGDIQFGIALESVNDMIEIVK